ncbi:hypothetical protein ACQPZ8_37450 [Actinomadura nitritigenes]|uniref:hypothetical protein n=1 Tax=Actinomadura nitritigenes TaxID=134602 RepID=UPI003D8D4F1F
MPHDELAEAARQALQDQAEAELRDAQQRARQRQEYLLEDGDVIVFEGVLGERAPVVIGGGPDLECARCSAAFTATGYRVVDYTGDEEWRDLCPGCATSDPALGPWQTFCRITGDVAALMTSTPDPQTRDHLRFMLGDAARYYALAPQQGTGS